MPGLECAGRGKVVQKCETRNMTVIEGAPDRPMARVNRYLAGLIEKNRDFCHGAVNRSRLSLSQKV